MNARINRPRLLVISGAILLIAAISPAFSQQSESSPPSPLAVPNAPAAVAPSTPQPAKPAEKFATVKPPATPPPAIPRPPEPAPAHESLPLGTSADAVAPGSTTGTSAAAASSIVPPAAASPPSSSSAWMLQTFAALALVIALILLIRYLIARITGHSGPARSDALAQIIARQMIAPRTQLLFLRVGHRIVVASHSPAGLSPLTELSDPDEVALILARAQAQRPTSISRGFRQLLGRFDDQHNPRHPDDTDTTEPDAHIDEPAARVRDEVSSLLARLRAMKKGDDK
jgi:flagellar biogenesis protein FliO